MSGTLEKEAMWSKELKKKEKYIFSQKKIDNDNLILTLSNKNCPFNKSF